MEQQVVQFDGLWMSRKDGLIRLVRLAADCSGGKMVVLPGGSSSKQGMALGMLRLSDVAVLISRCHELSSRPVCSDRVLWMEGDAVVDIWDRKLLEAAKKSATSIESKDIPTYLAQAFRGLRPSTEISMSQVSVALCMTTKNRLWQLRHSLPLNLMHAWPHRRWAKIHLVDFGSTDGTLEWIMMHCRSAIDADLLQVYSVDDMPDWHASVAKNTSHMVASEDILVNVDGDNLIGPGFPVDVVTRMTTGGLRVLQYFDADGTCGRIACWREDFHKLRGYDEDAYPMGAQDTDLVARLKEVNGNLFKRVTGTCHGHAIPNSIEAKVAECIAEVGCAKRLRWGQMDFFNQCIFRARRNAGHIVRNGGSAQIGLPAYQVPWRDVT